MPAHAFSLPDTEEFSTARPRLGPQVDVTVVPPRPPAVPEHRLMLAVLEQALADFHSSALAGEPEDRFVQELIGWFASTDRTGSYGFETICDVLGFQPEMIRRRLRRVSWSGGRR
jgi:hypothetical protein